MNLEALAVLAAMTDKMGASSPAKSDQVGLLLSALTDFKPQKFKAGDVIVGRGVVSLYKNSDQPHVVVQGLGATVARDNSEGSNSLAAMNDYAVLCFAGSKIALHNIDSRFFRLAEDGEFDEPSVADS